MNANADRPEADAAAAGEASSEEPREPPEEPVARDAEQGPSIESLQSKVDENWDRYLRAAAEVENVRKRAARDVEHARKFALENFSKELLAVRDTLEMGLEASATADVESLREGSEATLKLLTTVLERFGIVEVDPVGEPFDPELHEAMTMQPSDTAEPGSVLTVIQKGYSLNGRLLRPARVIVAAEPPADG